MKVSKAQMFISFVDEAFSPGAKRIMKGVGIGAAALGAGALAYQHFKTGGSLFGGGGAPHVPDSIATPTMPSTPIMSPHSAPPMGAPDMIHPGGMSSTPHMSPMTGHQASNWTPSVHDPMTHATDMPGRHSIGGVEPGDGGWKAPARTWTPTIRGTVTHATDMSGPHSIGGVEPGDGGWHTPAPRKPDLEIPFGMHGARPVGPRGL